jgi:recombination protein RecT
VSNVTDTIKAELVARDERGRAPTIFEALELAEPRLQTLLPTGTITYAYAKAALGQALRDNPKLIECDPHTLLGAWAYTLQLGLPLGPLGLAYLIPYGSDAVCVVGYRGYIELAYRSGLTKAIRARLVFEGEHFREKGGTSAGIEHEIHPHDDETPIVAAYATADLKSGGKVWEVIREREWERARKASPLGKKNVGPWAEHFPEMVLKTSVRRLEKWLPKSPAMMQAAAWDETPPEPFEPLPVEGIEGDGG